MASASALFEAKKRFGLSVLNYMVNVQPHSPFGEGHGPQHYRAEHAVNCRTHAQEYNQRKGRQGAF